MEEIRSIPERWPDIALMAIGLHEQRKECAESGTGSTLTGESSSSANLLGPLGDVATVSAKRESTEVRHDVLAAIWPRGSRKYGTTMWSLSQ